MKSNVTPVVGGLIQSLDLELLFVRTHKWKDFFSIPGGKVQYGESLEDAIKREIKEETNLDVSHVMMGPTFDSIESHQFWKKEHFIMINFLCLLQPTCKKTDLVLNEEAEEYIWISPEKAKMLLMNEETKKLLSWYLKTFGYFGSIGFEQQEMFANIGAYAEEKGAPQPISVSLKVCYDMKQAQSKDQLSQAIDYTSLLDLCKTISLSKHFDLLETLAYTLAANIRSSFPVEEVEIKIEKPKSLQNQNSFVHIQQTFWEPEK